ncbi:MAG: hypothetical protein AAB477_01145 [Patescibacteria group bacterium]
MLLKPLRKKKNIYKLLFGFTILFFLIYSPLPAFAANPFTSFSNSILNAYNTYFIKPLAETLSPLFYQPPLPIKTETPVIPTTNLAPTSSTPITVVTNTPKKVVFKTETTNPVTSESSVFSIIKRLLSQKEYQDLLRGPKGDSGPLSIQPSSPAPIPVFYAPIGIVQPNPATNFGGASFFNATELSSKYFRTTIANIETLNVSGNSTLTGDLNVIGNITGNVLGTINPSFTLGSVPFQGATGLAEDNANLFWDDTTNRLGIGDLTPDGTLDIDSSVTTGVNFGITNTGVYTGTGLLSVIANSATTGTIGLMTGNGLTSGNILSLTSSSAAATTGQKGLNVALTGALTGAQTTYGGYFSNTRTGASAVNVGAYFTASGATGANYAAIFDAGNVGIGTTTPQDRLDVGTGRITGGTNSASFRNYLNLSSTAGWASADIVFPGGCSSGCGAFSAGAGIFRSAQLSFVGTNDIFFQLVPLTTSGYGYLEAWNSAGLILGTGNNTSPIIFKPNRTEYMRILGTGEVGIGGDATPDSMFSVGSTSQFQVNSSGAIAAATGIVSSGTIQFSALTTNGALYTSGGNGTLTTTAPTSGQSDTGLVAEPHFLQQQQTILFPFLLTQLLRQTKPLKGYKQALLQVLIMRGISQTPVLPQRMSDSMRQHPVGQIITLVFLKMEKCLSVQLLTSVRTHFRLQGMRI